MEGDKVGCKCGGTLEIKNGKLVCKECGLESPYQPAPTYEQLIAENNRLRQRLLEIEKELATCLQKPTTAPRMAK